MRSYCKVLLEVIAVATIFTRQDVQNNVCWALCRNDGYDTGNYEKHTDACICGNRKRYKEYTDKVIKIAPKKETEWDE